MGKVEKIKNHSLFTFIFRFARGWREGRSALTENWICVRISPLPLHSLSSRSFDSWAAYSIQSLRYKRRDIFITISYLCLYMSGVILYVIPYDRYAGQLVGDISMMRLLSPIGQDHSVPEAVDRGSLALALGLCFVRAFIFSVCVHILRGN